MEGRKAIAWPAWAGMALAWGALLATLFLTILAWQVARNNALDDAQRRFDFRVAEIRFAVLARMRAQEQVLRGAAGLFEASERVSRQEWRAYVSALRLQENYPGILGIGFVRRLAPESLAAHERSVREEGFPEYAVRPAGVRDEYTAIVYIEPFDSRNRRAFGYDMFTEPVRRAAMAAARDTGQTQISGKVILIQEAESDAQAGFLMYLPIYRHGAPIQTVAQRRDALFGYVYSPLRVQDLMEGILGRELPDVRLQIYDGKAVDAAQSMYASPPSSASDKARFTRDSRLEIEGHPWTLRVTSLPDFESAVRHDEVKLILVAGIVISLLLFLVAWSLATLRARALAMAAGMTAALRESREELRAAAETAHDAIVSANAEGCIVYFNSAAERIFGYPQEEALGQPLTILMPERFRERHLAGFSRYGASGEEHGVIGHTLELVGQHKDGWEFPLEISVTTWETRRGRFFTGILRDITERQRSEEKIRELNARLHKQVEQLAAANRELESFSYSVSHDLRAPLRAMDGFATIIAEDFGPALGQEGVRLLGVIRDNARRMGQLIDDLLAFSRLGRAAMARSRVDMTVLAREAAEEIRAGGEGATAQFSIGELPAAWGDGSLLRQVWVNLLANAVKFSRFRRPPRIEVGGEQSGGENVYFVRDNGVGFDMAYASQLFGVFQRLHHNDEFPGTGVGLAIVQRIIDKHGGRVWAEGQVDRGATFRFALPRGEGDA